MDREKRQLIEGFLEKQAAYITASLRDLFLVKPTVTIKVKLESGEEINRAAGVGFPSE